MRRLITHKSFDKQFGKLPKEIQQKFLDRSNVFLHDVANPLLNDHALTGKWAGHRSINVTGDFRALYRLIAEDEYLFAAIGTHSELYGS